MLIFTGTDEYPMDEEELRLLCMTGDDVDRCLGPNKENVPPFSEFDDEVATVLERWDPVARPLLQFFSQKKWLSCMDFVVQAAAAQSIQSFVERRPDRRFEKRFKEKREVARAQFRWRTEPEFPWSESYIFKEAKTVCLPCHYVLTMLIPSSCLSYPFRDWVLSRDSRYPNFCSSLRLVFDLVSGSTGWRMWRRHCQMSFLDCVVVLSGVGSMPIWLTVMWTLTHRGLCV